MGSIEYIEKKMIDGLLPNKIMKPASFK